MEEKYFVKKGDESGKLYKLFSSQYSDVDKKIKTYTSVGGGFDFTFLTDDEVEPAPTHLIVAARLRGDFDDKDVQCKIYEQRLAIQARQFQLEQEISEYRFKRQLTEQLEINKNFLSTIGLTQEQVNNQISQIQKGVVP